MLTMVSAIFQINVDHGAEVGFNDDGYFLWW